MNNHQQQQQQQQQSNSQVNPVADNDIEISVSKFDYSIENHFKAIDKIAMISGESEIEYERNDILRLNSSVTFLRKWRDFCYQPRAIRFACENESSLEIDVTAQMDLPQFSSAAVPKDMPDGNTISSPLSKDFVMYVGGHVWALDWCPRIHQSSHSDINVEFIAVSAHPPESSYNKIGAPLTGRGLVQIWCILNAGVKDHNGTPLVKVKLKKYSKNNETNQSKRPRGRPRKNPANEPVNNMDDSDQFKQDLAVQSPENSNKLLQLVTKDETNKSLRSCKSQKPQGRPRKKPVSESVSKMDGSDQFIQDLTFQSPESSNKLLQLVSNEETEKSSKSCKPQKPRGKYRKKPVKEPVNNVDDCNKIMHSLPECPDYSLKASLQPLTVEFPEHSPEMLAVDNVNLLTPEFSAQEYRKKSTEDGVDNSYCNNQHLLVLSERLNNHFIALSNKTHEQATLKVYTRKRKDYNEECSAKSKWTSSKTRLKKCETRDSSQVNGAHPPLLSQNCGSSLQQDPVLSEPVHNGGSIPEDVALPRLVMGLAHNGKVAWDVKWRPSASCVISKHVMGHLAVLLGNGALEVWEVPLPHATKAIFSSSQKEGTDPRFIKLKPILICSMLMCGNRKSIPLILEWSTSAPHDLILAGCHDGVVALWKVSDNDPSKDTRPLLCFSADNAPIRALKWAPVASDPESENIIVTAGHKGVKFWDIREPFHPLWDIPGQRIINSLDWLPDPKCVVLSFDDGEIRIISLLKAASDAPVTGMPCVKTQQNGLNSYHCSSSSIWSIQVSITGMVAYCCSDGKVLHFQLTTKAVEKDPHRNREPHFLCGSLTKEESTLTVFSPLPNVPFSLKKSSNKWGDTPRSRRGFITLSNQEKRGKDQLSKSQTSEKQPSGHNMCSEGTLVKSQKSNTSGKSKTGQELVYIDNENKSEEEDVKTEMPNEEEREVFPSRMVAMHRVRWNMNKGSERLLCSGGAAGIVRCQLII